MSLYSKILFIVSLISLSAFAVQAQDDQAKYLSGVVPEVEGKVVFSQTIHSKQSASQLYSLVENWIAQKRTSDNDFYKTRTLFADSLKHELVVQVNDRLIFVKTAFNLDYALVSYYLMFRTYDNGCKITVRNIKYQYADNKELLSAESMIADAVALNKEQTKLLRDHDKFRIATINMVEDIAKQLDQYFNGSAYEAVIEAYKSQSNVPEAVRPLTQASVAPMQTDTIEEIREKTKVITELVPATQVTTASTKDLPKSKEVKRAEDILFQQISTKAFALSNYFVVGESIAYVRQLSALSVGEADGKVAIVGYLNDEGAVLPQSLIMPSAKFYLFYCNPNYQQYYELSRLSEKYAEGKAYTNADIALIEQLQATSKPLFELNRLKIDKIPTADLNKNLLDTDSLQISNAVKTDSCVVISGEVVQ